ncbi:MAG TPA: hypothetical protein VGP47_08560 [Parachlamydiaceae bacterium]|nr:hypothetical protein [Parachlamydiaceae bacterium]
MTTINFNQILESSAFPDNSSLDDPRRIKLNHSLWQKLTHYKEKKQLDEKLKHEVLSFFQERYGFQDKKSFQRIWNILGAKVWTTKNTLTVGTIRDIDTKFRKELIYHGSGIRPHPPKSHPSYDPIPKLVLALLHGESFSPFKMEERTVKAIFIMHDKELMKQFQHELQMEMDNLAINPPKNSREEVVWRAFLGNIIALLPYSYPSTGDIFSIPVFEKGACRKVNYHTEVMPLAYNQHSSPMTALGFTSSEDPTAPAILSFTGTTYPAGKGFITTLLADFTPGHSVGEIIYKRNRKQIDLWLAGKKNIHVVGMSLGGAMSFHTLRFHHQIARVDAYNPPGLYFGNWKRGVGSTCKVNIYCQPGDSVSKQGLWPTGENIWLFTVYPHQKGVKEDAFSSHARAFTGCDKITIIREDPKKKNRSIRRYLLTKFHQFSGPIAVFIPLICTLFLYRLAKSVHQVSLYCLNKFR